MKELKHKSYGYIESKDMYVLSVDFDLKLKIGAFVFWRGNLCEIKNVVYGGFLETDMQVLLEELK